MKSSWKYLSRETFFIILRFFYFFVTNQITSLSLLSKDNQIRRWLMIIFEIKNHLLTDFDSVC